MGAESRAAPQARASGVAETCDTIQLANHFIIHGIGMTSIDTAKTTSARHRMAKPPPWNSRRGAPSMLRQIQRRKYLNAHAQPMIVMNETLSAGSSRYSRAGRRRRRLWSRRRRWRDGRRTSAGSPNRRRWRAARRSPRRLAARAAPPRAPARAMDEAEADEQPPDLADLGIESERPIAGQSDLAGEPLVVPDARPRRRNDDATPSARTMVRQNRPQAGNAPVSAPGAAVVAATARRIGGGDARAGKAAARAATASARSQSLIPAVQVSVSARTIPRRTRPTICSTAIGPCCWPASST